MYTPRKYILVSGIGEDIFQLVSFDKALFASGLSNYNLVKVSSILPPNCKEEKDIVIENGSIVFTAYASISSNKSGIISAAIGAGVPMEPNKPGVIMEFSCFNSKQYAVSNVEEMVRRAMLLRNIDIKEIKTASVETKACEECYSTAFAALAMW